MTRAEARRIAKRHLRDILTRIEQRLGAPPGSLRDISGTTVLVTDYPDEATFHFIKTEDPTLTLQDHRLINEEFAREVRQRGANVRFVTVTLEQYFDWLVTRQRADSPSARAEFIAELHEP